MAPEKRLPAAPTGMSASVEDGDHRAQLEHPAHACGRHAAARRSPSCGCTGAPRPRRGRAKSAMVSSGQVVGWDEVAAIKLRRARAGGGGGQLRQVDRPPRAGLRAALRLRGHRGRQHRPVERALGALPRALSRRAPAAPRASPPPPARRGAALLAAARRPLSTGAPLRGELTYVVLRGTGADGPLAAITRAPLRDTSYTDTGLANETLYRYAVRAVRARGAATAYSEPSAPAAVTPVDRTAPAPPPTSSRFPRRRRCGWPGTRAPPGRGDSTWCTGPPARGRSCASERRPRSRPCSSTARWATGARYRYAVSALDAARRPTRARARTWPRSAFLTRRERQVRPRSPRLPRDPAGGGGAAATRRPPA